MRNALLSIALWLCLIPASALPANDVPSVSWDRHSLIIDGRRVVPVMGEIHYSRLPANEWAEEIRKMKDGGVTIIATYVFWSHIEEQEGIFDWSGQRNLRRFVQLCGEQGLPVVLRIGPFCHGEVRCGGIPDWVIQSGVKTRSLDPKFLGYTTTLYRQIFTQVHGLLWKDGGPIIACQFDNEFGGDGAYLMELKRIAREIGFELPFYTRTAWPRLSKPVPFGEMIPLYGDYADGFWDRSTREGAGNYWKAFHFKASPEAATDMGAQEKEQAAEGQPSATPKTEAYPYFTCELGGGMMTSYHRRVYLYPEDAYAMALVKLGSGSNLLGYYMYHGGTNPDGKLTTLNEMQRTLATNHNDLPVKTYDFQAPLGEFGQPNPHYYSLRPLHLFMQDFGALLAPMEAHFPNADREAKKGDDTYLRWTYRCEAETEQGEGKEGKASGFVFVNNYERLADLKEKNGVQFEACGVKFPKMPITVPAGTMTIFPVNLRLPNGALIDYATAQPVGYRDGRMWFERKQGIAAEFCINGRVRLVKKTSMEKPFAKVGGVALYLVDTELAERLFLEGPVLNTTASASRPSTAPDKPLAVLAISQSKSADLPREITIGAAKVAEEPTDADFEQAAVYHIAMPTDSILRQGLLRIEYRGDVARLYANGKLVADNFYNGRPFLMGLWRLPADVKELELRILPLQADMPVYFPREANTKPGEAVLNVNIMVQ